MQPFSHAYELQDIFDVLGEVVRTRRIFGSKSQVETPLDNESVLRATQSITYGYPQKFRAQGLEEIFLDNEQPISVLSILANGTIKIKDLLGNPEGIIFEERKGRGNYYTLKLGDTDLAYFADGQRHIYINPGIILDDNKEAQTKLASVLDTLVDGYAPKIMLLGDGYMPKKPGRVANAFFKAINLVLRTMNIEPHDCPCIVNPTSKYANVLMKIVYEDGTSPVEYGWVMEPNSSLHARLDELTIGEQPLIRKDKTYSVVIYSDNPNVNGVMARAWPIMFRHPAFHGSAAATERLITPDRMPVNELISKIEQAQQGVLYKGKKYQGERPLEK